MMNCQRNSHMYNRVYQPVTQDQCILYNTCSRSLRAAKVESNCRLHRKKCTQTRGPMGTTHVCTCAVRSPVRGRGGVTHGGVPPPWSPPARSAPRWVPGVATHFTPPPQAHYRAGGRRECGRGRCPCLCAHFPVLCATASSKVLSQL